MRYYLTTKGDTYIRSEPRVVTTNMVGKYPIGTIVEGDEMVAETPTRLWLKVIWINGQAPSTQVYVASWVCTVVENDVTPPVYPDFVYDASTESEWPIEVFHNDVSIGIFNGVIRVVSKNPTLKLT